ncbi:GCN5-related N-acetyltransferase (GNAT) family protein [Corchorus olitorius]|uniref:GCN5-related N-acetyltransferase (GNAT) family protein n=1 Tax=Corchorus olitorius TaxID=93759 RepID=A0A1R3J541_9ROSI|nr:GCN5-related N-acetyltransferase (GNAT) family protein [Corchorus olitorius]
MVAVADAAISSASSCIQIMMMQGGGGGGGGSKFMELRWVTRRKRLNPNPNSTEFGSLKSKPPPLMMPIYISTEPSHVNIQELGKLYSSCNYSCNRFPEVEPNTGVVREAMDMGKLRIALSNSCAIVSVFCKPQQIEIQNQGKGFVGDLMESVTPVSPSNGKLVGFGRAVSDLGLTASIYDVMVTRLSNGLVGNSC